MIRKLLLLAAVTLLVASLDVFSNLYIHTSAAEPLRSVTIEGLELNLSENDGKCMLEGDNLLLLLDIPWPCAFHAETSAVPRTVEDADATVALVEHSKASKEDPSNCVTNVQAIRIEEMKVTVSEYKDRVSVCLPFRWDEKVYQGLFAD